ncbi:phosphoribosylanthranilate isomerase [Acinetobacter sp. ESL0695]|uniref:phosphoribosylanthranilate isomerase n=1 Tax=Acinetobacter sp. ESL0695 TaxID=2983215 RepID=UPI0023F56D87|nr:phosphoribosylanthranilate isomerase [Acinetobacter sp. ESL0695]WEV49292.1 phosphoribosylanthranilate isomerase [Acinetobacter sp. ESL0695]
MRTRAKICGITRLEDAQAVVNAGADAIGLVFYKPSPRAVSVSQAEKIVKMIPPYVQIVGLFVNAEIDEIRNILHDVSIDVLQFHGNETPEQCTSIAQAFGKRWYKAIQVKPELDLIGEIQRYQKAGASAILLDAWHPELKGGTGLQFDWSQFPDLDIPLILAGGLTPENITEAIQMTHPFAVDVSGGVEASKGIKDHQLIEKFMQGVHCGSAK